MMMMLMMLFTLREPALAEEHSVDSGGVSGEA